MIEKVRRELVVILGHSTTVSALKWIVTVVAASVQIIYSLILEWDSTNASEYLLPFR